MPSGPDVMLELRRFFGSRGISVLRVSGWSLVARISIAGNLFITIPFVRAALGAELFGAWATLISLMVLGGFLDFGFSNGAMNLAASACGRGKAEEVAKIASVTYRFLVQISLTAAVMVVILLPLIPWYQLLGLSEQLDDASRSAAALVLFAIVLMIPLNLANRLLLGMGKGALTFKCQAIAQLVTMFVVIMAASAGASMVTLVALSAFSPLIGPLACTRFLLFHFEASRAVQMPPDLNLFMRIKQEGAMFFGLQLAAVMAYSLDLILIASLCGAEEAGKYAIVLRVFSVIPQALGLVWVPLWPEYRRALAAGKMEWAKKVFKNSVILSVTFAIFMGAAIALAFDFFVQVWIGGMIGVPSILIFGFVIWGIVEAVGSAISAFLNAASIMRFQLCVALIFSSSCIGLKIISLNALSYEFFPLVTSFSFLVANLLPTVMCWPRISRLISNRQASL